MTKQVRREIEEMLKDFGGAARPAASTQYSVPGTQREEERATGEGSRVVDVRPQTSEVSDTQKKQDKAKRAQRRAWKEMMDEAGCRLPFPEEREDVHQVLIYVLGRLVARKMRPTNAEAVVHVCKLMMRI